jgi:hypothetical protein
VEPPLEGGVTVFRLHLFFLAAAAFFDFLHFLAACAEGPAAPAGRALTAAIANAAHIAPIRSRLISPIPYSGRPSLTALDSRIHDQDKCPGVW